MRFRLFKFSNHKYFRKKMQSLSRFNTSSLINTLKPTNYSWFSLFAPALAKQIETIKEGKELIVKGVTVPSGREDQLLKNPSSVSCAICSSGLDIKHTDVLIISQFVRSDGCMLPRRITGLCRKQQRRMSDLVAMAQKAGLMPNLNPANSKKDPKTRYGWKKYNKYFDESTIKTF